MNYPSVKNIMAILRVSNVVAERIRFGMKYKTDAMRFIDGCLGTYGVEYIPKGHNAKSPAIEYCNIGDAYAPTVMLINGRFVLGCWGDIVERGNYD